MHKRQQTVCTPENMSQGGGSVKPLEATPSGSGDEGGIVALVRLRFVAGSPLGDLIGANTLDFTPWPFYDGAITITDAFIDRPAAPPTSALTSIASGTRCTPCRFR